MIQIYIIKKWLKRNFGFIITMSLIAFIIWLAFRPKMYLPWQKEVIKDALREVKEENK